MEHTIINDSVFHLSVPQVDHNANWAATERLFEQS
jgi:hypothetical protein